MIDKIKGLFRKTGQEEPAEVPSVPPAEAETQPAQPQAHNPGQARLRNAPVQTQRFEAAMPLLPITTGNNKLSIVVIVYKMPQQAERTLYSLSTEYQRGIEADDYEVIVVENRSTDVLGEERATQYGGNFKYFLRDEQSHSPVPAINFGAEQSTGTHICIMIDGARMVTPGLVNLMLSAAGLAEKAVVTVPGYHLGEKVQQKAVLEGYNQEVETKLLEDAKWTEDGYRLFDISCLSVTSFRGYYLPFGESNCICVSRSLWGVLNGFDEAFDETGGGQVNLDFFKRAIELPDSVFIVLPGEGSFHQYHGGITTGSQGEERQKSMQDHFDQYARLRGGPYKPPAKRPLYLGAFHDSASAMLAHSADFFAKVIDRDKD